MAIEIRDIVALPEQAAKTDDYQLVLTDEYKTIPVNAATQKTITVPANATVAFPINTVIGVRWESGAVGQPAIAAAGGVTIVNTGGDLLVPAENVTVMLKKIATNTWVLNNGVPTTGGSDWTRVTKGSNQSGITSTSYIDITDLTFAITSGQTVEIRGNIYATSTNATEGLNIAMNGPTASSLIFQSFFPLTTVAITGYSANAYDNPAGASATFQNAGGIIQFRALLTVSANGSVIMRVRAETGSGQSVAILAGSYIEYKVIS